MHILVTGGNGFIGKRLVHRLEAMGHKVYTHDQQDGDITIKGVLDKYLEFNIEYVFHLAARTFVPMSWDETYDYFNTNIMGTVEVLEFCRKRKCPVVLMSTYVYGEPEFLPVSEEHRVTAPTPYHKTKIINEEMGEFYARQFQIPVTVFRPFNVYGYGQNDAFLLPKIMKQVMDDSISTIEVMDLTPKRDYVYVEDVVGALCAALQLKRGFQVYNIGYGSSVSVEEAIQICLKVTGKDKDYVALGKSRPNEISDCVADIEKIKKDLGFCPQYDLHQGVEHWYHTILERECTNGI